jgi:hypothetical protein
MNYEVVFDVDRAGFAAWPFVAFGVAFVIVGVLLVRNPHRLGRRAPPGVRVAFSYAFLIFSVLWTLLTFNATYGDYRRLRSDLDAGRCAVVEGAVTGFVPAARAPTRVQYESFAVDNQRFSYSDYVVTAGFHQTSMRGGPLRAGLRVRIHHRRGEIARLEIAD